jgi:hypothetical protein
MPPVQAPPDSPDQAELEALIEEARRRARRRRLGYLAIVAGVLGLAGGLYLAFGGGGGTGPSGGGGSPQPLPSAGAHGIRVRLQPGWHVAARILTPRLVNPRELLSVGTFQMRPGGRCAQSPSTAYSDMGPSDGLITFMERKGHAENYQARPAEFRLRPTPGPGDCAPASVATQMAAFRDHGRIVYAFVALGGRGPQNEAESILNSLRVSHRR